MPISTAEQLTTLQDQLRKIIPQDLSRALNLLEEALPEGRAKHIGRPSDNCQIKK